MTSSEDVLLQVGQVRYKKGDGTLYVMNERLAWMMDHRDTVSVSHRYTDIKMQKISPEGKPKIQLQVVLHDGSASTFQFVNKVGHENQIKERDDVKQLLQQLLVKFKSEVNKELEEKNRMLSENPAMLQLYRDLVTTQVISSEEFWAHHTSQFFKQQQLAPKQDIGVTGAFLADIKPQTDGCNGLKYNLTTDIIECIFKTYPAVRKKHLDQVPHKVQEGDFWTKFFQSHYFHRDRINTGTKDLFTECAKLDDLELKNDINAGIDDLLVDLMSFDDKTLDEGYGTGMEKSSSSGGNQVHQSMIKRFNQHSIMVLKACKKGTENGESSVIVPEENPSALSLNNLSSAVAVPGPKRGANSVLSSGSNSPCVSANASPRPDLDQNGKFDFHQAKKLRIQEKISFEDLKCTVDEESDTSSRLNLFKVDRYLHGPLLEAGQQDPLRDDLDGEPQMFGVNNEVASWNGRKNLSRGAALVSPAAAVGALGELTPGGALMKGFREESLAHMVHKETQRELKNLYLSSCELLRHFWASYPPTTPALEAKAVRMHEALHRFHSARLKPFEDRLSREFSPLSKQLTSHLNQMLNYAYRKFATWQHRQQVR